MSNLRTCSQRVRVTALVFIVPMLIAPALRAGEIHDAAAAGDLNKVRAILEGDPMLLESKDDIGRTPLIRACQTLQLAVANFLIDKGANVNARDKYGGSSLYRATHDGDECLDLIQRLIAKGADINARLSANGFTPLHRVATETDNLKVARLLIGHGADLDARSVHGSVLQTAINHDLGKEKMAEFMVESGAKLQEYSYGNTDLHLAALKGYADLARLLVKHGADVSAVNVYNHTALYYAARHGRRKVAEALIAAGANTSDIVETNYGKAPQLAETLKEGEAYLWFLGGWSPGVGYAVKTKGHLLIFNPSGIDESPEAGLANGYLNPNELAGQRITVLLTHRSGPSVSSLAKTMPGAEFILNAKPTADDAGNSDIPPYRLATPNESFSMGGVQVHTIPAMRRVFFGGEGFGYLVEADGVKVLHAGLHVSSNKLSDLVEYRKQIDSLKPFGPIDIAVLPIKGRHIDFAYEPYLYLLDQLSPKAVYLIGDDLVTEEHPRCVEVLRSRNIPVAYPEGGIAIGERFHYLRDQASAAPLPKTDARSLSNAYLGQLPPDGTPQVFARGVVSTDHLEHSAPAFSPDGNEVFWSIWRRPEKGEPQVIMTMRCEGGRWSVPAVAPFSGKNVDGGPVFSPDGKRLYFASADAAPPPPGGSRVSDIVYVEKTENGWSERRSLGLLTVFPELKSIGGPSFTRTGTLYFRGASGFYRAEFVNGRHAKPQLLPPSINQLGVLNWTPFIAPDESYLLFSSGRAGSLDRYGDIYISCRMSDGSWADPVNLGEPVNTDQQERFQMVSPDGKYLFFTRPTPGHDQDVYWVEVAAIPALRPMTHPLQENPK